MLYQKTKRIQMTTLTRQRYRDWVRERTGTIHQNFIKDKHQNKKWRINQNHIRDTFIEEYNNSPYIPTYMITRNYHYDEYNIDRVKSDNKRINMVIEDFLNPRGMSEYFICKDHFIERHKDKLVEKKTIKRKTKEDVYDFDFAMEIKPGGFHVHTLFSQIDDDIVLNPNSKIRKSLDKIYGWDQIPISLMQDEEGMNRVKSDLIEYAIRQRCDFIGNSKESIDIQVKEEYAEYDGYRSWKGMVAYCTKNMYNVDNIDEIYDQENSYILKF